MDVCFGTRSVPSQKTAEAATNDPIPPIPMNVPIGSTHRRGKTYGDTPIEWSWFSREAQHLELLRAKPTKINNGHRSPFPVFPVHAETGNTATH